MLAVVSPAKSMDLESPLPTSQHSLPRLLDRSAALIDILRDYSPSELSSLMRISDELAALNGQRYLEWTTPFTTDNARPAILTFSGDVYQGLNASTRFTEDDYTEAQQTLRILSGLYGLLRPLDLIQPYRLEMGTKLATARGTTLYAYWGSTLTELLKTDLDASPGDKVLVNLASQEYFNAIKPTDLNARIIAPRFEDETARGGFKVVSFHAKRARGEMASWMIRNQIRQADDLTEFNAVGYRYVTEDSTTNVPVFRRSRAARVTS